MTSVHSLAVLDAAEMAPHFRRRDLPWLVGRAPLFRDHVAKLRWVLSRAPATTLSYLWQVKLRIV